MISYQFFVRGLPRPQGSMRAFPTRSGKIAVTADNPKLYDWRTLVSYHAQLVVSGHSVILGPVELMLKFFLPRPKSVAKNRVWPITKPDVSKLLRAVEDALTGIIYHDDAQICRESITKEYGEPGVEVKVGEI